MSDETSEVKPHGSHIAGDENPAGICSDAQDLRIRSPFWKHSSGGSEVNGRLPSPQPSSDVRIDIGVGLKRKPQVRLADLSFFTRSNRSIISAGIGFRALISSNRRSCSFR